MNILSFESFDFFVEILQLIKIVRVTKRWLEIGTVVADAPCRFEELPVVMPAFTF